MQIQRLLRPVKWKTFDYMEMDICSTQVKAFILETSLARAGKKMAFWEKTTQDWIATGFQWFIDAVSHAFGTSSHVWALSSLFSRQPVRSQC